MRHSIFALSLLICPLAWAEDDYQFLQPVYLAETGENDATSALAEGFEGLEDEPRIDPAKEPIDGAGGFDNVAPKLGSEEGPGGLDWDPSPTYRTRYKNGTDYAIGAGTRLQGNNWFLKIPYITYDSGSNEYRVRFDANMFRVYAFSSGSTWVGQYANANSTIVRSGSSGSYTWLLYDTRGKVYTFSEASPANGRCTKIEGLGDPEITFTYNSGDITVLHKVSSAGGTEIRRFTYTITSTRLDKIDIEEWVASAWVLYRKIDFTYPEDVTGEVECSAGDLIEIKDETLLSAASTWLTRKWVYKYFTGTYNSSTNPGNPYQVKAVIEPEAVHDYEVANPSTGIHTQTASQLASYVDRQYEYASDRRVRQIDFNSDCCGGGGEGVYGYTWDVNGGSITNLNTWAHRVTITLPSVNGSSRIIDFNKYGQKFNYIAQEVATDSGSERWIQTWAHNAAGTLSDSYSVKACDTYNDSTHAVATNTTAGMRFIYTYGLYNEMILKKLRDPGNGNQLFYHKKAFSQITSGSRMRFVKTSDKVYPTEVTTDTGFNQTQWSYTYHSSDALQVKKRTTTMPIVTTGENGLNTAITTSDYFSLDGLRNWSKDGDSFVHYTGFDSQRQTVTKTVRNIDTDTNDRPSGVPAPPSGEGFDSSTGLNIVTDFEYDTLRRPTKQTNPAFNAVDAGSIVSTSTTKRWWYTKLSGGEYVTVEYPHVDSAFYNAALTLTVRDYDGNVVTSALGELSTSYDDTTLSDDFDATQSTLSAGFHGTIVRRTDFTVTGGHVTLEEVWIDADNAGAGKYTTEHVYDASGVKLTTENPAGTFTRWAYDVFDRVTSRKVGTIDGGASDNMVVAEEFVYDDAGSLSQRSLFTSDGGSAKTTSYTYDYRQRETQRDEPLSVRETRTYTNLNNPKVISKLNSSGSVLMAKTENFYDSWGRIYEVRESGVSGGSESGYASERTWRNARGLRIKVLTQGKILEKTQYDGAGRITNRATTYDTAESSYGDADDLTGDTVIEETRYTLDATGQPELVGHFQRNHDGSGTGALDGSSGNARAQYACTWYDKVGRKSVAALYGTNDGTDLNSRPSGAPPSTGSSPTDQETLVTTTVYTVKGEVFEVSDPMSIEARTLYDDPGHVVSKIEDYGGTARTMDYTYDSAGRLWKITANATGADQITEYVYGVVEGTDNSTVSSNDYVYKIKWPDPSSGSPSSATDDQELFGYDLQGNLVWRKGQYTTGGTALQRTFDYDDRGRLAHDRVTTIGTGIDGAVLRISREYDVLDRPTTVTSYDHATAGSGNVVNQILYEYTRFDRILKLYQAWAGLVNTADLPTGSPRIAYAYSFPSDGTTGIRRTSSTLTGGTVITDEYNSGADDNLSRISGRKSSSVWLFQESYLGLGRLVERQYGATGRLWTLVGSSLDSVNNDYYVGLDRHGRIDNLIVKNGGTNLNRYVYTYNYNSQVTLREDEVGNISGSYEFDEKFVYDGLGRLTEHKRGKDLNGTPVVKSCRGWTLNLSGGSTTITSGTSSCSSSTNYAFNKSNEITTSPYVYSLMGAQTTSPTCDHVFDAWGRLVEVKVGGVAVAKYKYNGDGWKTKRTNGTFVDTYYYYNEDWQLMEERKVSNGDVLYWYNWGSQYIDDLVVRSVSGGSTTKFFVTDARYNTTTVLNHDGTVDCRYCYEAYGTPKEMGSTWGSWQAVTQDRFLFQGRFYTVDVDQYDFRNRVLCGVDNYMMQMDPIGRLADEANFGNGFVFLGNDPISGVDPYGLSGPGDDIDDGACECISQGCPAACETTMKNMESWVPVCFCRDVGKGNLPGKQCYRALHSNVHCCYTPGDGNLYQHDWGAHLDMVPPINGAEANGDCDYNVVTGAIHLLVDTGPDFVLRPFILFYRAASRGWDTFKGRSAVAPKYDWGGYN